MAQAEHLAHWDDVAGVRREAGHIAGSWRNLGDAAGSVGAGVNLIDIEPGKWSTPAHTEGAAEELFYVLAGSGISWQGSREGGATYAVAEGDFLLHRPHGPAHTLRAGRDGLSVLAFGERISHGNTLLPRAGVAWLYPGFVDAVPVGEGRHPYRREAEAGEPDVGEPAERPSTIVALQDVPLVEHGRGGSRILERDLGRAAGSERTGMAHVTIPPGSLGWPPHRHSAEEEIFVGLVGAGTLLLGEEQHPVRRGHVVARPPGTRVAHSFRAGDAGLTYLAYGTREPNDIVFYPRSGKVSLRGVGVIGRLEPLDYWDGEE